jgi:anti-sigma factor ChrR (cupin superfamily)
MNVEGVVWSELKDAPVLHRNERFRVRPLWEDQRGVAKAMVVEIDPGGIYPGLDLHEPGPEEVYVVAGIFNDGVRDYPAGTFIHNPAGSSHIPQSETGCTLFLF